MQYDKQRLTFYRLTEEVIRRRLARYHLEFKCSFVAEHYRLETISCGKGGNYTTERVGRTPS